MKKKAPKEDDIEEHSHIEHNDPAEKLEHKKRIEMDIKTVTKVKKGKKDGQDIPLQ